jgi:hypothetical protein
LRGEPRGEVGGEVEGGSTFGRAGSIWEGSIVSKASSLPKVVAAKEVGSRFAARFVRLLRAIVVVGVVMVLRYNSYGQRTQIESR